MALTDLRRAYQQSYRAKHGGYSSEQTRAFEKAINDINNSGLSRMEKSALKNEAAKAFLDTGMGTKTGINAAYERALSESGKAGKLMEGQSLSTTEKARFANASSGAQVVEAVKRTAGSEQVKFAADVAGNDSDKFYDILGGMVNILYDNPDATPGELNDYIMEFAEY